jgi:hypothetical protein
MEHADDNRAASSSASFTRLWIRSELGHQVGDGGVVACR